MDGDVMMRSRRWLWTLGFAVLAAQPAAAQAQKLTPLSFTLNWVPSIDHAGYCAAKLAGLYEKEGLDVVIKPGGPQINVHQLLAAGQTDLIMGTTMRAFNARQNGVPIVTIAAWYQKDATTLMLHPENAAKDLAELKTNPMFIPNISKVNYWPWLKIKYGYSDEQLKPYDFSFRTWAIDPRAASQGYITNDRPNMARVGVTNGRSLLLADFGWDQYINTVDTLDATVAERPDVLRRFLKATAAGWHLYFSDPAATHAELARLNPDLRPEDLDYSHKVMRDYGLLGADGSLKHLGEISEPRMLKFAEDMVRAGALGPSDAYQKAFTVKFMDALSAQ
jgi:NitT/TauT family transport system substrate-binding protein